MQVTRQLAGVEAQLATAIETFLDHHSQAGHSHGESNAVRLIFCLFARPSTSHPGHQTFPSFRIVLLVQTIAVLLHLHNLGSIYLFIQCITFILQL